MAWLAPSPQAAVVGTVAVPGSKSESNRALVLAALSGGTSRLRGVLEARDTQLMIAGLRALGAHIDAEGDEWRVTGPAEFMAPADPIDCGLAGTVMRFLPPVAALADGLTTFVGDEHASARPLGPLLDALAQLGAPSTADALPFTLRGGSLLGSQAVIDSSASSQFISGLLLAAARFPEGLDLTHRGTSVPSLPHIRMTEQMLHARGVDVRQTDETRWQVAPGPVAAIDQLIEPDLTNAAVFLAAAMVTGGAVTIPGWPRNSIQPGNLFREVVEEMGAKPVQTDEGLVVKAGDELIGADLDLHAASELTPVVAGLCSLAEGSSQIRGVAHIRGHETNRLEAICTELSALGVDIHEAEDGLRIVGRGASGLRPIRPFATYGDHRMAHLAALMGLRVPGLEVADIGVVTKTMPDFTDRWETLVGVR